MDSVPNCLRLISSKTLLNFSKLIIYVPLPSTCVSVLIKNVCHPVQNFSLILKLLILYQVTTLSQRLIFWISPDQGLVQHSYISWYTNFINVISIGFKIVYHQGFFVTVCGGTAYQEMKMTKVCMSVLYQQDKLRMYQIRAKISKIGYTEIVFVVND